MLRTGFLRATPHSPNPKAPARGGGGGGTSAENDSMGGFYITPPFFVGQNFMQK